MPKKIGIIGAGQLALMLVQSASKFGVECICLDPNPLSPAFKICKESIIKPYSDKEALKLLESKVDVILYEFENIDLDSLEGINNIFSTTKMLEVSKNRIGEKKFAKLNGFKIPNFCEVTNEKTLLEAIQKIGLGGILKTCELGYDGKGQIHINSQEDIESAKNLLNVQCIYEEKINFDFEMSMIAIRSKADIKVFPPFLNQHVNGILHKTDLADNLIDKTIAKTGNKLIQDFMVNNNFYGILCIEMFVKDDQIYFNEIAPRPHNSGHVTQDSTNVSQFDLYVRAALDYKLIEPKIIRPMSMINILGQHYNIALELLTGEYVAKDGNKINLNIEEDLYVCLYGKDQAKLDRKMGHINVCGKDLINKVDEEIRNVK